MRTETQLVILLILLVIFPLVWSILQSIRFGFWLPKPIQEKKPRIAKPLKPKTPDDCPICREEKISPANEAQTRQAIDDALTGQNLHKAESIDALFDELSA